MAELHIAAKLGTEGVEEGGKKIRSTLKSVADTARQTTKDMAAQTQKIGDSAADSANRLKKTLADAYKSAGTLSASELKNSINLQVSTLKKLEQKYKETAQAIQSMSAGSDKDALSKKLRDQREEIDMESSALEGLRRKYSELTPEAINVRTEMTRLTNQLAAMKLSGQENTKEYKDLTDQLGKLATAQREVARGRLADSTGATQWTGMIEGVQGLMGAYTAASGVIGIFAKDQESLMKIQTRMQASMSVLMGMQQVANTLHSTSTFRLRTLTAAQNIYNAAIKKTYTALRSMGVGLKAARVAAQALTGALTLGIGVAITALITLLSNFISKQQEAKKKQAEFNKSVSEGAAEPVAAYKKLQQEYSRLGNDMAKKSKFLKEHAQDFRDLGVAITSVQEAESLLVQNSDKFIAAQIAKSKANILIKKTEEEGINKLIDLERQRAEEVAKNGEYVTPKTKDLKKSEMQNLIDKGLAKEGDFTAKSMGTDNPQLYYDYVGKPLEMYNPLVEELDTKIKEANTKIDGDLQKAADYKKEYNSILEDMGVPAVNGSGDEKKDPAKDTPEKQAVYDEGAAQEARRKLMAESVRDEERQAQEREWAISQARIDAMEKGSAREIAQMQLNEEKRQAQRKREELEAISAVIETERKVWDEQQKIEVGSGRQEKPQEFDPMTMMSDEGRKSIDAIKKNYDELNGIENETFNTDLAKVLSSSIETYAGYFKQREEIERKYQELRASFFNDDGELKQEYKDQGYDGATVEAEISGKEQEDTEAIDMAFAQRQDAFVAWSNEIAKLSLDQLQEELEKAKSALSQMERSGSANANEVASARAAVATLEGQIKDVNAKGTAPDKRSAKEWKALAGAIGNSGKALKGIGGEIGGIAGEILTFAGDIADTCSGMITNIVNLTSKSTESTVGMSKAASTAIKAVEAASVILAIIQLAMKIISGIFNIIKANKAANEAAQTATENYRKSLEKLANSDAIEKLKTAFGEDSYNMFREYADQMETLANRMDKNKDKLNGMSSDMRSGWQKFWNKKQNNIKGLEEKDYLDENGEFDGDKLKAWYEQFGKKMEKADKKIVESMIDDWEEYKKCLEEVTAYISDLFGNVADDIADAMIEAFAASGDAAVDLKDIAADMAKNMAKSYVKSMLLGQVFNDKLEEMVKKRLAEGDTEGAINAMAQALEDASAMSGTITEYLKGVNDMVDMSDDSREGASKGIAQASQNSVDELNGRMTAIQGHTYEINANVKDLARTSGDILRTLMNIESDTKRLGSIENEIRSTRKILDDIAVKGVNVKTA